MTQEQKDLLLKDLCARLPYGVKVKFEYVIISPAKIIGINKFFIECEDISADIEDIKPYLFPLSSMTEEQKKEFDISMDMGYAAAYNAEINCANRMIDFFHKHHIDYRGLIPMGLANDATGLNIY